MRRLNKTTPFVLILVVFMFLPGCIAQEEWTPYMGRTVVVQAGNTQPKFKFTPGPLDPATADIRLGAGIYGSYTWFDVPNLDNTLNNIIEYGAWRVDTCLEENEPPIYWEYSNEEEFPEEYDQFIDGLNDHGVSVDYMLHFWDKTGHANGSDLSTPRFQTEEQIQDFLNYTRFVVSHYKDLVQYYTIWSEPDACPGIKCIEPEDYIELVNRTVPVIHEEDPNTKVAIAPNVLFFAQDYLSTVIESDIMTMVDVIQWHGIYNVLPNDLFYRDYYYQYPTIIEGIREAAAAHGFDGEYWATEISYGGLGNHSGPWGNPQTDKEAAKYSSRAVVMHLGGDIGVSMYPWLPDVPENTPWTHRVTSNLYKVLAGSTPSNLNAEIKSEPTNTLSYSFELPNGDKLFAYWTHGEAVYDDSGVKTTLTFPGLSAQKVVAIDTLNGFEQELFKRMENGNLIIPNIYLMDYPVILRINNDTSTITSQDQLLLMQLSIVIGVPVVVVGVLVFWKKRPMAKGT